MAEEELTEELDPGPSWKPPSIPPPSPSRGSGPGEQSPRSRRRNKESPSQSPPGPAEKSSTQGSTRAAQPADPSDLYEIGAVIISGASKALTWLLRKRSGGVDLSMTEGEAAAVARPIVRLVLRRFHVNGDVKDAVDVGRSADSVLGWGLRVLSGAPPPGGHAAADQEARRAAGEAAERARRDADRARAQAEVDHIEAVARDASARETADGRRELGEDKAATLDPFEFGNEDV